MEALQSLLKFAINMGASDVHIKPGRNATIRVASELHPVQEVLPTNEQVQQMVAHMLPRHLVARLEREKEVDFSFVAEGLGRFRVNVFQQRGQLCIAMRYVKEHIPSFEELH